MISNPSRLLSPTREGGCNMDNRNRIECTKPEDRDMLVMILARNGYTVKQLKEPKGKGRMYTHFIEYWRDGEPIE